MGQWQQHESLWITCFAFCDRAVQRLNNYHDHHHIQGEASSNGIQEWLRYSIIFAAILVSALPSACYRWGDGRANLVVTHSNKYGAESSCRFHSCHLAHHPPAPPPSLYPYPELSVLALFAVATRSFFCVESDTTQLPASLAFVQISSCYPIVILTICLSALTLLIAIAVPGHGMMESRDTYMILLDDMTISDTSSDLCPNLTASVFGFGAGPILFSSLKAMIQSRLRPNSPRPPLACLRIFDPRHTVSLPKLISQIANFRRQGLDAAFLHEQDVERLTEKDFF
jgi:hypothetical protein